MMFECIDKIYSSVSIDIVTGAICSFNDEYGNLPLKSCVSQISGYQEGSGTPSPSNVRPLHAWSGANLTACGVNLFDLSRFATEYPSYCSMSDGVLNVTTNTILLTQGVKVYIPSNISRCRITFDVLVGSATNPRVKIDYEDGTSSTIAPLEYREDWTPVSVLLNSKKIVAIKLNWSNGGTFSLRNFIINFSSPQIDGNYYPYNGNTYTFAFGQDIYQGSIDWKRGVVVGNAVLADLGDRNWNLMTDANGDFFRSLSLPPVKETGIRLCSNYALGNPYAVTTDNIFFVYNSTDTVGGVLVRDARYTDPTAFKTAMNGVMLAYELANPITIPLGGINLLTQQGQNNIYCDTGDTTVEYIKIV